MLRFDYEEQPNGQFNITVVSEKGDTHSLCGRLVLDTKEWEMIWTACAIIDIPDFDRRENFFKFENKKENKDVKV